MINNETQISIYNTASLLREYLFCPEQAFSTNMRIWMMLLPYISPRRCFR